MVSQKAAELVQEETKELKKTLKKEVEKEKAIITKEVTAEITKAQELEKLAEQKEAMRYRLPFGFNQYANPDRKMGSDIPFSFLRRMAVLYPIARACINRRIRQMTQLDWDITTVDEIEGEEGYEAQIQTAKNFFIEPSSGMKFRDFLTLMIDDLLVVDAISFEYQRSRGGKFLSLVPVDPTTIVLRVTPQGATPEPPDIAYAQYIRGQKIADFTTEELFYTMMNRKSYSPYGLAPLESLILQAEAALRGTMYNLNYFRESNVPEGFINLPEDIATTKDRVEEWQTWFDMMVAGDVRFTHRLKILPGGATYTPAKKPEDMSFQKFELWLLQQTCAIFDVPPQDIGITYQVNKATGEIQQDVGRERGLYPLANFFREMFNSWIANELGMPALQFVWQNLNPTDRKEEAEIAEKEIHMGALSVDEYRLEHGMEAIGLGHYVMTATGPVMLSTLLTGGKEVEPKPGQPEAEGAETEEAPAGAGKAKEVSQDQLEQQDIKRWRKCIYADLDKGRPLRVNFKSDFIRKDTYNLIHEGLAGIKNRHQAKLFFDQFLDPEIRASMKLLQVAAQMRRIEDADILPL